MSLPGGPLGIPGRASEDKTGTATEFHKESPGRLSPQASHKWRPHCASLLLSLYFFVILVVLPSRMSDNFSSTRAFMAEAAGSGSRGRVDLDSVKVDGDEKTAATASTLSGAHNETVDNIVKGGGVPRGQDTDIMPRATITSRSTKFSSRVAFRRTGILAMTFVASL
uniref:Uncharacterized protein n=1 Tax=Neospora caninum (strain Liverpool) TaxID=572307 RepID=F0JAY1_NEOCL|nr:hypothetical protein, conserved [Neospora caninum Liverpool]CEL71247.1 TPA: hypothetical protein, conserved [Neospora caninum Liverpool]